MYIIIINLNNFITISITTYYTSVGFAHWHFAYGGGGVNGVNLFQSFGFH